MKVLEIEQRTPEWFAAREGAITGSKLGGVFAKKRGVNDYDVSKRQMGFWEIVAERLAVGTADDGGKDEGLGSSRERGKDMEEEAFERLKEEMILPNLVRGKMWESDKRYHLHSPDANTEDLTVVAEIKCVSSAAHIRAIYEDDPYNLGKTNYFAEYVNYFLVNPTAKELIVFLYDPRFIAPRLQWHAWVLTREMMAEQIERMTEVKDEALAQIDAVTKELYEKHKES